MSTQEIESLKVQLNENALEFKKVFKRMENDMKLIKSEWETKCNEISEESQRKCVSHSLTISSFWCPRGAKYLAGRQLLSLGVACTQ